MVEVDTPKMLLLSCMTRFIIFPPEPLDEPKVKSHPFRRSEAFGRGPGARLLPWRRLSIPRQPGFEPSVP